MFTRIVSFTGAKNLEAGVTFVRDVVTPVLHSQVGWRGTTATADRINGIFAVLTLWESEAARDASESALLKVRDEGHKIIGGQMSVDYYEEVGAQIATLPPVGSKLLLTKATMDTATIDENIASFAREVVPRITAAPGFLAYRQMVNRTTGDSLVGTTWKDADSRRAALAMAEDRQRSGEVPSTVTIRERGERDIVFIDIPT